MDTIELRIADSASVWREREGMRRRRTDDSSADRASYRMKLGRETIQLDSIPFRILQFLSAHPYRAFTRRRIAEAVSSRRYPVGEEQLDGHIGSLRRQLGFFRDYVQTVPYIGYRFKA